jgi:hypothetical protein
VDIKQEQEQEGTTMSFTPEQFAKVQKLKDIVDKRAEDLKKLSGIPYLDASRELEAAVGRLGALMQKYSITNEDIRRKAGGAPREELIVDWYFNLSTKGGHGLSRITAVGHVVRAMGGKYAFWNNVYDCYMKITAPESVIENMKILFPTLVLQMENLANRFSRDEARNHREIWWRSIDPKQSVLNRRGFIQGFGVGVANRITMAQREDITEDYAKNGESGGYALVVLTRQQRVEAQYRAQNPNFYDKDGKEKPGTRHQEFSGDAFGSGHQAGMAFASPKIGGSRTSINS